MPKLKSQNLSSFSKPPSNIASDNLRDSSNARREIVPIVEVIDDVKLIDDVEVIDDVKLIDDVEVIDDVKLISGEITCESSNHKPGSIVSFSLSIAPVA